MDRSASLPLLLKLGNAGTAFFVCDRLPVTAAASCDKLGVGVGRHEILLVHPCAVEEVRPMPREHESEAPVVRQTWGTSTACTQRTSQEARST